MNKPDVRQVVGDPPPCGSPDWNGGTVDAPTNVKGGVADEATKTRMDVIAMNCTGGGESHRRSRRRRMPSRARHKRMRSRARHKRMRSRGKDKRMRSRARHKRTQRRRGFRPVWLR